MAVTDTLSSVLDGILREVGKTLGTRKRAARRKRRTASTATPTGSARPKRARRQVSRARSNANRAAPQRRRVAAKTAKHRKSLRAGKARR